MKNNTAKNLAYSGVFIALLIVLQLVTKSMGQLVTGSCVNFVLISSALLGGAVPAAAAALISPFLAFALGIGPMFIQIVPMIALGNLVITTCYLLILYNDANPRPFKWIAAIIVSALLKFAVLYIAVVKITLPLIPDLTPQQLQKLSAMFTLPQLITALIGGVIAFAVVPQVKRAINKSEK